MHFTVLRESASHFFNKLLDFTESCYMLGNDADRFLILRFQDNGPELLIDRR